MPVLCSSSSIYTRARRLTQHQAVTACVVRSLRRRYATWSAVVSNFQARQNFTVASSLRCQDPANQLHQELAQIDGSIRRTGRVSLRYVDYVIELAQQQQGNVSPASMAQLLRLTGEHLRQLSPAERTAFTKIVWNLSDPQRLDISHYNALLQVYLENETPFNPYAFLEMLSDANIMPNRVTYQKLIQRLCDMGDTAGANKMHELMINEQLPVSERVFNALVRGHLLAGDEAAARRVIDVMGEGELRPTAETYTVLACGLVEKGLGERALKAIEGRCLSDEQILRIAKAFALRDNVDAVRTITEKMPLTVGYTQDLVNSCLELLSLKKLDAARVILNKLPVDPLRKSFGKFFIVQMVRSGLPVADVSTLCNELREKDMQSDGLLVAVEAALRFGDRESALRYLFLMPTAGFPLRTHFFYPIVCKAANEVEVYNTVRTMTSLKVPITNEFLVDYVLPRVDCSCSQHVVRRLVHCGCTLSTCANAVAKHMLIEGEVERSLAVLDGHACDISMYLAGLAGEAATPENMDLCIEVLQRVFDYQMGCESEKANRADPVGDFVNAVDYKVLDTAVAAINARGRLQVDENLYKQRVYRDANRSNLAVGDVTTERVFRSLSGYSHTGIRLGELESHLVELEKSNSAKTHDVVSRLLIEYCRFRNVEKSEEMLRKLGRQKLSGTLLSSLVDLYLDVGDTERAFRFYLEVLKLPNFKIKDRLVVGLAAATIRTGGLGEAKAILSNHAFDTTEAGRRATQQMTIRLVDTTTEIYGVKEALKMLDDHISRFAHVGCATIRPIMTALQNCGDVDGAIKLFNHRSIHYRMPAARHKLYLQLMADHNQEELDKAIELSKQTVGVVNTNLDLAICYAVTGKFDKTRDLLRDIPMRNVHCIIERQANFYIESGIIDKLEKISDWAVKVTNYDKRKIYHLLIRGYCNVGRFHKALDVWTEAQEENVLLSEQTLRYLARRLDRCGLKVPFVVPGENESPLHSDSSSMDNNSFSNAQIAHAPQNPVEDAVKRLEQLPSSRQSIGKDQAQELIITLTEAGQLDVAFGVLINEVRERRREHSYLRPQVVRMLLSNMAQRGMVDKIESLRSLFDQEYCELYMIDYHLCHAYRNAGRADEYLDIVERMPPGAIISRLWANAFIESYPNDRLRVLQIARRFASKGNNYKMLINIWLRLVAQDQCSQADALSAEFPQIFKHHMQFQKVRGSFHGIADHDMNERLLAILQRNGATKQLYATVLSDHIQLLLSRGRIDEAHEWLKNALCSGGLDVSLCKISTLRRLKTELSRAGKDADIPLPRSEAHDF